MIAINNNKFTFDDNIEQKALIETLADDGSYDLPANTTGMIILMVGDAEMQANIRYSSTATVTIFQKSSIDIVNTDTDTKFCIYDSGSNTVRITNRLGSEKECMILVLYHP
jgi:hypothetical protein